MHLNDLNDIKVVIIMLVNQTTYANSDSLTCNVHVFAVTTGIAITSLTYFSLLSCALHSANEHGLGW